MHPKCKKTCTKCGKEENTVEHRKYKQTVIARSPRKLARSVEKKKIHEERRKQRQMVMRKEHEKTCAEHGIEENTGGV